VLARHQIRGKTVPPEIKEYAFDTGVVTLNYAEVSSPGAPLVLLHGGSARWQSFDVLLADLAAAWRLYAPDFRGHGKSTWIPGSYRLQDYTDDVIAFLRQRVKGSAYLFGHSLGGMVALLVAAQYAEGVRAVAVGDAPLSSETWHTILLQGQDRVIAWRELAGGQKPMDEVIQALKDAPIEVPGRAGSVPMREVLGDDAPVFEWLATNLRQNDPDMLTALISRFESTTAGYEMDSVLPAIQCPVLLLQADPAAGGLMTDSEVECALSLLAQPTHVQLTGISHMFHNDRKEPIVQALQAFFQAC
jgi:pimeloyl-ACP methyl ester carboxylesterase